MKQHKYAPLWMLYARSTLPALLAVLALTAAAETVLFRLNWAGAVSLDRVFQNSRLSLVMAASLIVWTLVLSLPGWERAAHTLNRLPAGRFAQFLCHVGYNVLCYLLLWGFQVSLIFGLSLWFGTQAEPEIFGAQSILLLFYRSYPLHALLPLEDWSLWCKSLAYLLCLSVAAAYPVHQRKKSLSRYIISAVLLAILLLTFPNGIERYTYNLGRAALALLAAVFLLCWQQAVSGPEGEADDDDA